MLFLFCTTNWLNSWLTKSLHFTNLITTSGILSNIKKRVTHSPEGTFICILDSFFSFIRIILTNSYFSNGIFSRRPIIINRDHYEHHDIVILKHVFLLNRIPTW